MTQSASTTPCAEKRVTAATSGRGGAGTSDRTTEALAQLLHRYYDEGRTGKEKTVQHFQGTPDAAVFPVLEQALRDNADANVRNAAMEVYVALGGRSLPPLVSLLSDADEEVRTFTGVMLGNMRLRDAVPALIRALDDPDLNVKHAATEALGKIRDLRAVGPLIEALGKDMWLQFPAAVALGDLGDPRAVPALVGLLSIPGANVPAIQALGKIGDPSALGPLGPFLEDEEPSLREWALEAVAVLARRQQAHAKRIPLSRKAENVLLSALSSESIKARRNAMIVLGRAGSRAALPTVSKFLADREMREDALEAIIHIGGEEALREVTSYTGNADPLVRRAAVEALASLGAERSVKTIIPLLDDPVESVRMEAALALSRVESKEARRALSAVLEKISGSAAEAREKITEAFHALTACPAGESPCNPADIVPLRDYISETFGLHYDDDRLNVLYHRLAPVAAASGCTSLAELHEHLLNAPGRTETLQRLAAMLTNNETYFFRETEQLREFIRSLLPALIEAKKHGAHKTVRVLSAGCSSGEEPYTVAIMLEEAGLREQGFGMEVVGLDIDADALALGERGRYSQRSFRTGQSPLVKKYFRPDGEAYLVDDRIRKVVQFRKGNLMADVDLGRFDMVLCRNVLIYFSDASVERVARNFHTLLLPTGYLLLGHSESLCRVNTDFAPLRLEGAVVYQKR
jgi:chemotaxis protein methyltransferase CheR